MPDLGTLEVAFLKPIVMPEIKILKFFYLHNIGKTILKCLNLGPKMPYLFFSEIEPEKAIVISQISILELV